MQERAWLQTGKKKSSHHRDIALFVMMVRMRMTSMRVIVVAMIVVRMLCGHRAVILNSNVA